MSSASTASPIPRDYNFAADILKRNLDAGRGGKTAFIDHRGACSYAELAERVERFGHVLRALGVRREERILICLTDTVDWPTAFLGAIKAGVVAVPVNTLMTEDDYAFMLEDSPRAAPGRVGGAAAEIRTRHRGVQASRRRHRLRRQRAWPRRFDDLLAAAKTEAVTAPTTRDDMCFWLYTSGSTGKPKGAVHTHADLKLTDDLYAAPDPRHHRERHLLLGGEIVFCLRARQRADLPDVGGRDHGAAAGAADAGSGRRSSEEARRDDLLCRADLLRRVSRQPGSAATRRAEIAALRFGRRGAADRCRPALERALRRRHPRRHRLDRDAAHLPVEPPGRREIRHQRQADRRL